MLQWEGIGGGGALRASAPHFAPDISTRISRFSAWKDFVHDHFPWLEMRNHSHSDFSAKVTVKKVASASLAMMNVASSEVRRTRQLADASDAGHIKLLWQMSGQLELEQDSRRCVLDQGQATVCDTARPYTIRMSEQAQFAVLMFDYAVCPGWERISQSVTGRTVRESAAVRATIGALSAISDLPAQTEEGGDTAHRAVQWMLTTLLHRTAEAPEISPYANRRLERAHEHILENIGDPSLCAEHLAAALCMSRRALYMLFKGSHSTPARMIQDIRIEKCKQALSDPANTRRKITDIAFDYGFNDYATFSRIFKSHCGLAPSEFRTKTLINAH